MNRCPNTTVLSCWRATAYAVSNRFVRGRHRRQ